MKSLYLLGLANTIKIFFILRYFNGNQIKLKIFKNPVFLRPKFDFSAGVSFYNKQYLYNFHDRESVKCIIDAGANIGQQTIKFLKEFQNAEKILSIEIDKDTFNVLNKNMENKKNVFCLNNAVSSENNKKLYYNQSKNSEMNRLSTDENQNKVTSISINEIIKKYSLPKIDIIKFNIEGNEKDVFFKNNEWVKISRVISFNNAHMTNYTENIIKEFSKYKSFNIINLHQFIFLIDKKEKITINRDYIFRNK